MDEEVDDVLDAGDDEVDFLGRGSWGGKCSVSEGLGEDGWGFGGMGKDGGRGVVEGV